MKHTRNVLRVLLPVAVVALALVATRAIVASREKPEPRPPEVALPLVTTVQAERRPVTLSVQAQGTVLPRTETMLRSEVPARVEEISPALASGGFFVEGEVLVRLDDTDQLLAVEQARAEVARAETRLRQEEADAAVARRDWESLGEEGEPSPLVLRQPQLAEARAEADAARAMLEKAKRDLERTVVRAPYAGRVRSRAVDVGQYVERSMQLATIYAVDWAEVRLPVPDSELALLELPFLRDGGEGAPGPRVVLSTRFARREQRWEGRIVRMEGAIDEDTRTVVLVARVQDPYGRSGSAEGAPAAPLLAGLFVDATIEGRRLADPIVLPRAALRSGSRVFVLDDEDRLEFRDVNVLSGDSERIVLDSGLEAGERVVVSPIELPIEGMALREEAETR